MEYCLEKAKNGELTCKVNINGTRGYPKAILKPWQRNHEQLKISIVHDVLDYLFTINFSEFVSTIANASHIPYQTVKI
jgi:hypothetical protein